MDEKDIERSFIINFFEQLILSLGYDQGNYNVKNLNIVKLGTYLYFYNKLFSDLKDEYKEKFINLPIIYFELKAIIIKEDFTYFKFNPKI